MSPVESPFAVAHRAHVEHDGLVCLLAVSQVEVITCGIVPIEFINTLQAPLGPQLHRPGRQDLIEIVLFAAVPKGALDEDDHSIHV